MSFPNFRGGTACADGRESDKRPGMAKRKGHGPHNKQAVREEALLQTAADCFCEYGYRATNLETIAERMGISRVTLYRYCPSKKELLVRIFERAMSFYQHDLRRICAQPIPAEEKLRQIIRHQIHAIVERRNILVVFFSEEGHLPEEMARRVRAERRAYDKIVEDTIAEGVQTGRVEPLPAKLVAFAILGMCNWLYQWYQPDGALSEDEVARNFIALVEGGCLRADPQREILARLDRVETALTALHKAPDV